ncbi:hypothetical protein Tco_0838876 [Tanacetum coccineum]|uniref:Uncharacterized protein n=1 Tax=Tanacetum coccineum TaxID=301880 RepID=A0ABQ5AQW2_9ASTR
MDTTYGRRWIRRIRNCEYAFSCEALALIRGIFFPGYGILVRNRIFSNVFILAPKYAPFSMSSQITPQLPIVTKSVFESAKKKSSGRSTQSVVIQDTLSTPKSKPATSKTKLKGAPSLTLQEQEAADIMQALKESKKTSRRQPSTGGSNEGTSSKPRVLDESTVISATSSEGTSAKAGVSDEDKDITKEKVILEWGDEQDSEFSYGDADDEGDDHVSDTHDADDEDVKTESDEDEIYKYKICVCNEEDVEMKDSKVEEFDKGEERLLMQQRKNLKRFQKQIMIPRNLNSLHLAQH